MNDTPKRGRKAKGYAILTTVLLASVLLPIVGLGIDVSILYVVRTELWKATDAAAFSGAQALGNGTTDTARQANATTAVNAIFAANFPTNFWHTTNPTIQIGFPTTGGKRFVKVTTTVTAPLYFLRILHQDSAVVAAITQAQRQDAVVILVMDDSASMTYVTSNGKSAIKNAKDAATNFVGSFVENHDMIGLVVFTAGVYTWNPTFTFNTKDAGNNTITSLIANINENPAGNTATALALAKAYDMLKAPGMAANLVGRVPIILLMTDGRPNGLTADYSILMTGEASKTGCQSDNDSTNNRNLLGTFARQANLTASNGVGNIGGIFKATLSSPANTDNSSLSVHDSTKCNFTNKNDSHWAYVDVNNVLPTQDFYGNWTVSNGAGYTSYTKLSKVFASDGSTVLWDHREPNLTGAFDSPPPSSKANSGAGNMLEVTMASVNAADYLGGVIRRDAAVQPQIFVIGVIGTSASDPADPVWMQKLANYYLDQSDPVLHAFALSQKTQTTGFYAEAPDPSKIAQAFRQVLAQIGVRLAK